MSDFKAKMHQIRFRLRQGAPPDPLAGFEGPTSKEGEGREKGGEGRGGEGGEGRREAFLVMWPRRLSVLNPPLVMGWPVGRWLCALDER